MTRFNKNQISGSSDWDAAFSWGDHNPELSNLSSDFTGFTGSILVDFQGHTGNSNIHFTQAQISITESQISDLGDYALIASFTGHTSDSTVHFTQAEISITESQISDFGTYSTVAQLDSLSGTLAEDIGNNTDSINNLESSFTGHTGDSTVHYTQSEISITESQISDLGTYNTVANFVAHTGTANPHNTDLGNLNDVDTAGATNGQALVFSGGTWGPDTVGAGAVSEAQFTGHTGQTGIHFTQDQISITESQISDLGDYTFNSTFNSHTGDSTIHFTQAQISITESQISDLQNYALSPALISHTGNSSIHFTQASISITESQISDLGDYATITELSTLSTSFTGHSGDSTIHFTMGDISITESQISNLQSYALQTAFSSHINDTDIHYEQSQISITESQISDLGSYALSADLTSLENSFTGHTGDSDIHFTQAQISITESQISDLGSYATVSSVNSLSDNFNGHTGLSNPHFTALEGLIDVTGTPSSGQSLVFDGSNWGPQTISGGGGSTPATGVVEVAHLLKTSTQNVGGANGTISYVNWESQLRLDAGYTHSTSVNPSRLQVDAEGRYTITATVSAQQGGGSRTTLRGFLRLNGSTIIDRAASRNYSRGSSYGDLTVSMNTELDLTSSDYIEVGIEVDDTDGTYTINTFNDECEFIVRRLEGISATTDLNGTLDMNLNTITNVALPATTFDATNKAYVDFLFDTLLLPTTLTGIRHPTNSYYFWEDFGPATNAWNFVRSQNGGTIYSNQMQFTNDIDEDIQGVARMDSQSTAGNWCIIGGAGARNMWGANMRMSTKFYMNNNGTAAAYRLGWGDQGNTNTYPTNGVWIEKLPSSTNWQAVFCEGGVYTTGSTGYAATNNQWATLQITSDIYGTGHEVLVDGVHLATFSGGLTGSSASVSGGFPFYWLESQSTTRFNLNIDYCYVTKFAMTR